MVAVWILGKGIEYAYNESYEMTMDKWVEFMLIMINSVIQLITQRELMKIGNKLSK